MPRAAVTLVLTHGDHEAPGLARSLRAALAGPEADILLIDHAPQGLDASGLDSRIRVVRIAPSARATARNRALHILGAQPGAGHRWIWVLEPGDTPACFALRELTRRLEATGATAAADLVIAPGIERRSGAAGPLPGQERLTALEQGWHAADTASLPEMSRIDAALVAPCAASRIVRASLVRRLGLRFSDDQAGGELLFSAAALLGTPTLARCPLPLFARDHALPAPLSPERLRDATRALTGLAASPWINDPALRLALVASLARDLLDRPEHGDPARRAQVSSLLALMLERADPRIGWSLDPVARAPAEAGLVAASATWLPAILAALPVPGGR